MKQVFSVFILCIFLVSCGKEILTETPEKQNFVIETREWIEFTWNINLEKTGRISSSQDIRLSSNAAGRIEKIFVKSGDNVAVGQILATIADTIGTYWINLERASNGLERARITYDSTKLQLEKQIFDTEKNLATLKRNLDTAKKNSEQNLLQAQDSLQNSQYLGLDSTSALRLEQLDNNIEKSKLDYQTKLITDTETIEWFRSSLKTNFNAMLLALDDIIDFSDEILWVTEINKDKNDKYEQFLWAYDVGQKWDTERSLRALIHLRSSEALSQEEENIKTGNLTEADIIVSIDFINSIYENEKNILASLELVLNNSIPSAGQLWNSEISAFISQINVYQATLQANYSGFIAFWSSTKSFLRTYKNNQDSLLKAIALQEKDKEIQFKNLISGELSANVGYEKTVIGIEESISNLETQIELAENTLKNTRENYDISLRSLNNGISESQITYAAALKEYEKLSIRSPINGTLSEKFIDEGQEVSLWSQLFNILSDNTPEVELSFSYDEKQLISEGQDVYIQNGVEKIKGAIYSVSEVADANLNYKSTIVFESGTNLIGNIVTVLIPLSTDKMLLPLNVISTEGSNIGYVKTLSGSSIENVRVRLGEVYGGYIEVISCAKNCVDLNIILNDVSNFDENKFVIIQK